MNEEEKQNHPQNDPASGRNDSQNGEHTGGRNRRRRHHRGGKRPESGNIEPREVKTPDAGAAQPNEHRDNDRKDDNRRGDNRQDRHQKHQRPHGNGGNRSRQQGLADLYGQPTEADALSLEELRAKIVIKSADAPAPAPEPPKAEPEPAEVPPSEIPADVLSPVPDEPIPPEPGEEQVEVIGVRFRSSGKTYYFDPKGKHVHAGQFAIVETARGPEFGEVSFGNRTVNKKNTVCPLRPLLRVATPEDAKHNEENRKKEADALKVCAERIVQHGLSMKLIDAQYAFDNSKLLFYFTSEGRVDFRDLVKDLAGYFRTRIELRQIGIRDEAKLLGGLGACGRPLCCSTFLPDFVQVSIKMAKEQSLSLNSAKISGVCGRLMCCLRYESETYAEEIRLTPPNDSIVKTPDGIGTVIGSTPLAGTVRVLLKDTPDTPPKQYPREEVTVIGKEKRESDDKKS